MEEVRYVHKSSVDGGAESIVPRSCLMPPGTSGVAHQSDTAGGSQYRNRKSATHNPTRVHAAQSELIEVLHLG